MADRFVLPDRHVVSVIAIVAFLVRLDGSPARADSLTDALGQAYATNPALLASRSALRGTDEHVPEALSGWRPHVEIHAETGTAERQNSIDLRYQPEHLTPQDFAVTATQNLYTSGRVRAEVKRAAEQVQLARAMLQTATNDVLLAAGTAYADVARDREIVRLDLNEEEVLRHLLASTRVALAAGQVTEADLGRTEARLADADALTASATATLRASEARYEQQIGSPPNTVTVPGEPLHLPASRDATLAAALADNPALVAAGDAVAISRLGVDIAIDELLPNVALVGLFERLREYEFESHAQSATEGQATVVLTMPLYQGGLLYARIREAKEGNVHAQDLLDEQRRQTRALALSTWAGLEAARTRVEDGKLSVAANAVALDGIARQEAVGARTVIDVLNAEQEDVASEVRLAVARRDLVVGGLAVLAATGALDVHTLALPVTPYDPDVHFRRVHERWAGTAPPPGDVVRPVGPIRPGL